MILLASLLTAVAVYVAVGVFTGHTVQPWSREPARPAISRRQVWLNQAGSRLTVLQFVALSLAAAFTTLVLVTAMTGAWWLAAVPSAASAALPKVYYTRRRAERIRRLRQAWPDALRDMLGSIAAGSTLVSALGDLSDRGPIPLRAAFGRFRLVSRMMGAVPALEMTKRARG